MNNLDYIQQILNDDDIKALLNKSNQTYHLQSLCPKDFILDSSEIELSCRLAFLLIGLSFKENADSKWIEYAYKLLKNIQFSRVEDFNIFDKIMGYDISDKALIYYFYLSSLALILDKTISARIDLKEYADFDKEEKSWEKRVFSGILKSLFFLIRKSNGFEDIRKAIFEISKLQNEQSKFEDEYLSKFDIQTQKEEALILVSLYHTSKAITETAEYLINGYEYKKRIDNVVRQHIDIALEIMPSNIRLRDFVYIIYQDLLCLIRNSIWNGTAFQDQIKKLCTFKSSQNILELLPSQRQAMQQNLFDVYANASIVQMPTSAGKTMLAEFNIVLTKSLRKDAKVVYVVPSRALVNQVYFDLRKDLSAIGLNVERTSSASEIDPTEADFLIADDVDIIVSTPEKLDLLIRRSHSSVEDVSLFIIDEAHTIENGERGAKLELLISMLRRERPNAKYMLLSPFLPGDKEALTEWLGGGNVINVDWKPSEKIIIGLTATKKKAKFRLLQSAYSFNLYQDDEKEIKNPYPLKSTTSKDHILEFSCRHFSAKGKTELILCKGRGSANKVAEKIYGWIDDSIDSEEIRLVQKYIDEELGCSTSFSRFLGKGVAVHHAGLSDETKLLTEHLIRQGLINFVCATTTIAEGVNFPVSTVYFDTYHRGGQNILSANDFWNIAGRAGRTLVDDFGKIILPFNTPKNIETGKSILRNGAEELTSVLAKLFVDREYILETLAKERGIEVLMYEYKESFGPIFQYFVHLLNVSDNEYAIEIDDLFKDSLVYFMLDNDRQRSKFIDLCRQIYFTIQSRYANNIGALKYADKTGFSVPSVLQIMHQKATNPAIADLDTWTVNVMFNRRNPNNLTEKIKAISELRETGLGTDDKAAPFNPELVAKMIIRWVKGDKINAISSIHPHFAADDADIRLTDFVSYMNQLRFKASWGLSALEGIVKGNENEMRDSYIPSYVYYGVDNNPSLAMRMLGIPRSLSLSLSQIITQPISQYSFSKLRKMINSLSLENWNELKPKHSKLTGDEWKHIVSILMK